MGDTDHASFGISVPGVALVMQIADVTVTDINGNCTRLMLDLFHAVGAL